MSVYLYDEAIVNKLRYWMNDSKISITDTDTVLSYRSDVAADDKVNLHIVSLTRLKYELLARGKNTLSRDGFKYAANEDNINQLRAIPIVINYQIDFISRHRKQNDDLVREFIFKLINNPELTVNIPYNGSTLSHSFSIDIGEEVEDNSDIEQHLEKGEKFRTTLNLTVENAYLFAYTEKETLDVETEIVLKGDDE